MPKKGSKKTCHPFGDRKVLFFYFLREQVNGQGGCQTKNTPDKGKPVERQGHKVFRPKAEQAMVAELPKEVPTCVFLKLS